MAKLRSARNAVRWRTDDHAWLDHAVLIDEDLDWIAKARLQRAVVLAADDPDRIRDHPSLREFGWFAEDVPGKATDYGAGLLEFFFGKLSTALILSVKMSVVAGSVEP